MRFLLLLVTSVGVLACEKSAAPSAEKVGEVAPASTTQAVSEAQKYGEGITRTTRDELKQVLATPDAYNGKTVVVEGHVRKACSRKGCWMELAEGSDAKAPGCRVTFKDYGFFVPTDSAGSKARVQAQVEVATVKARQVEHLEQEGATFSGKQADGTAREVRLVATGVELKR